MPARAASIVLFCSDPYERRAPAPSASVIHLKVNGVTMVTSRMLGAFRDRKSTRDEFLALVSHRASGI